MVERELPHAQKGVPKRRRPRTLLRSTLSLAVSVAVCFGSGPAFADGLDDRRDEVNQQIDAGNDRVASSEGAAERAAENLAKAREQLSAAESKLAETQADLSAARAAEQEIAEQLADATEKLETAQERVAEAERKVEEQRKKVGEVVRSGYQQRNDLAGAGIALGTDDAGDLANKTQWTSTMHDSTNADLKAFEAAQKDLEEKRDALASAKAVLAEKKQAAAENVSSKQSLADAASQQQAQVSQYVAASKEAKRTADAQAEADREYLAALETERSAVEERIAERVEESRQTTAEQAVAEREAREQAAAERAAEQDPEATQEPEPTVEPTQEPEAVQEQPSAEEAAEAAAEETVAEEPEPTQEPEPEATQEPEPEATQEPEPETTSDESQQAAEEASAAEAEAAAAQAEADAAQQEADRAAEEGAIERSQAPEAAPKEDSGEARDATGVAPAGNGFVRPSEGEVTSPYGMRLHPILGVWKLHDGTDFGAGCDTPIVAVKDGVVTEKYFNAGYGNRLQVDHGDFNGQNMVTSYNHASEFIVNPGDHVTQGQVLGYIGSTGYSTGCHLHFMVYLDGETVDPMTVIG